MNEIYKAIYDRLTAQLSATVYDHVPQDLGESSYPFVRLDPLQTNNNDVDDKSGFSATVQIVSFSRYRGSKEVSTIADSVYNAVHRYSFVDTASYGISGIEETFRRLTVQPDGLTRHSVQQFNIDFELLP